MDNIVVPCFLTHSVYLTCVVDSMLYWTEVNSSRSRVMRCRLNGSDVTTITTSIESPNGLYVDDRSASLYVLQGDNGALHRCSRLDHGQFLDDHDALHSVCPSVCLSVRVQMSHAGFREKCALDSVVDFGAMYIVCLFTWLPH